MNKSLARVTLATLLTTSAAVAQVTNDPFPQPIATTEGVITIRFAEFTTIPDFGGAALAIKGRAALVGITDKTFEIAQYEEVLNKEAEIIGVSDHLASELPMLIEWVRQEKLDLSNVITRTIPLDADAINETLDGLEKFGDEGRVVIKPELNYRP